MLASSYQRLYHSVNSRPRGRPLEFLIVRIAEYSNAEKIHVLINDVPNGYLDSIITLDEGWACISVDAPGAESRWEFLTDTSEDNPLEVAINVY